MNFYYRFSREKPIFQIQHRQQVSDLNKSMVQGEDLRKAAREIFGPPVDQARPASKPSEARVRAQQPRWYE